VDAAIAEDPATPPRHDLRAACRCRPSTRTTSAPCRRWPHRCLPRQRGQRPGPSPIRPESPSPGLPSRHLEPDGLPPLPRVAIRPGLPPGCGCDDEPCGFRLCSGCPDRSRVGSRVAGVDPEGSDARRPYPDDGVLKPLVQGLAALGERRHQRPAPRGPAGLADSLGTGNVSGGRRTVQGGIIGEATHLIARSAR
jgi:hypothetical protein